MTRDPELEPLDQYVRRGLAGLGAVLHERPPSPARSVIWRGASVPVHRGIRQFVDDVTWPEGVTFAGEVRPGREVWLARFGGFSMLSDQYACAAQKPYAVIGTYDGGNYSMLFALDDDQPWNPIVYGLDHDEFDREIPRTLHGLGPVLMLIRPETG